MTNRAKKKYISLLISIAAVVFFTLPFWLSKKEISVYSFNKLSDKEQIFVKELEKIGYKLQYLSLDNKESSNIAIWFGSPEIVKNAQLSNAKHNFVYVTDYYPVSFEKNIGYPIVLTPHKALYEHYTRSNIKTALLDIENKSSSMQLKNIIDWLETN